MWLHAIPWIISPIISLHYEWSCAAHMGIYSLDSVNQTDGFSAKGIEALARLESPPDDGVGYSVASAFISLSNFLILIIEISIPAGKHAVRLAAPPTPPALPAPPAAAPKGGGLLQSISLSMSGSRNDQITAATFLEPGTLHVHLVRSAVQTGKKLARLQHRTDTMCTSRSDR